MNTALLIQFCEAIGISRSELVEVDRYNELKLRKPITAGVLKKISQDSLLEFPGCLGSALNMKIYIQGDDPLLEIKQGKLNNAENALVELNERESEVLLQVEISINKQAFISDFGLRNAHCHSLCFVFSDGLLNFIKNSTLLDIDRLLFPEPSLPTIVIVLDASYSYKGDLFTIVGVAARNTLGPDFDFDRADVKKQVDSYSKTAHENLSWIGFRLKNLTPRHFMCVCEQNNDASLTMELMNRLFCLCIIYTANRTSYVEESKSFYATYANSDQTSSLLIGHIKEISEDTQKTLLRFAEWVYEGRPTDRLIILQNVAARELWLNDHEKNFEKLKKELNHVIADADRNYRIYTDGRIDKHFDAAKSLSDYISSITKDVSNTVDTITKGLIDSLLATIGFIVATVIAALIKGETQSIIFSVGMKTYAAYVLLFQLAYRMYSIHGSYSLLQKECRQRISEYTDRLYLSEAGLSSLESPLKARQKQFTRWFWVTVIIYLLIGIALLWLSNPAHLLEVGLITP